MITQEKFDFIKEKYGYCASWAVWAEQSVKAKSNMGDLTILDPQINKELLNQLNPNVVFVAYNFARDVKQEDFGNFHSDYPYATDYKTRYAVKGTKFWGGYMTDIIKDHPEIESAKVKSFLKKNPQAEKNNVERFRQELQNIGAVNPTIIAFGNDVYEILERHLKNEFKIVKISHYAHLMNPDEYRREVQDVESMEK